jgi:hypothetical protein
MYSKLSQPVYPIVPSPVKYQKKRVISILWISVQLGGHAKWGRMGGKLQMGVGGSKKNEEIEDYLIAAPILMASKYEPYH